MRSFLRHLGPVLACAVSAAFVYLAFRKVNLAELRAAFLGVNYPLIVLGALVGLGGFVVRSFGWKHLLAPVGRLSGWRLFSPVAIGYMANNVLPARLGEFARAYVVGKRESVSKSAALATIILERIFDGLTLLLILAVVSVFFPFPAWVKQGGALVAGVFLGLSAFLGILAVKLPLGLRLIDSTLGRLLPGTAARMKSRLSCFVVGLDVKNHWRDALIAFVATMFRWAFEACIYLSVLFAMQLQDRVPIYGALFVMVAVNIACMVPQAPGFVGSVQLACIHSLAVFGVGRNEAVAYSLLVHAGFYFPITFAGIACLVKSHLRFADLRTQDAPQAPPEAPSSHGG